MNSLGLARACMVAVAGVLVMIRPATAQPLGTGFTYQGVLSDGGQAANGVYDLRFRLYTAASGGAQLGATLCADNLSAVGGRFTAVLDFGAQFAGQRRWLEIEVRRDTGLTCGTTTGYTLLAPRQELTPTPNADFALTAASATAATNATQLGGHDGAFYQDAGNLNAGTVADARLAATVARTNTTQTFTGALTLSNAANAITGTFTGNGAAITGLSAANIAAGTLADARLSANVALLNGVQTFTAAKTFSAQPAFTAAGIPFSVTSAGLVGNLNADMLDGQHGAFYQDAANLTGSLADARLSANVARLNVSQTFTGQPTFSVQPVFSSAAVPFLVTSTANVANLNADLLDGQHGAYYQSASNMVFGTLNDARLSTNIPRLDAANSFAGAINTFVNIRATGWIGSDTNAVDLRASGVSALRLQGSAVSPNIIAGSIANSVTTGTVGAAIGGGGSIGSANRVTDNYGTVAGGLMNRAGDDAGTTGDRGYGTVSGGLFNVASGTYGTVGGGSSNSALGDNSTVAGGGGNIAGPVSSTVGGGSANQASGSGSTVAGGTLNVASGVSSTAGGGNNVLASGDYSVVPGGLQNAAGGAFSFAAGFSAKVRNGAEAGGQADDGTYVWADRSAGSFASTGAGQYLIRARGGVGVNTNAPMADLSIAGGLQVDQAGTSDAILASNARFVGLRFGANNSGEGIASRRIQGTNRYGLDFITSYTPRLSIANNGNVGIQSAQPGSLFEIGSVGSATIAVATSDGGAVQMLRNGDPPLFQTFTATASGTVQAITLILRSTGYPFTPPTDTWGAVTVALQTLDGSTTLASVVGDAAQNGYPSFSRVYTFDNPPTITSGQQYRISVSFSGIYDHVQWWYLTGNQYAGGAASTDPDRDFKCSVAVETPSGGVLFAVNSAGRAGIGTGNPGTNKLRVEGNISAVSIDAALKSFKIDHPLDAPNKYLYHSCVESPDMMNIYNGNTVTGDDGLATIVLPEWFEALNRDFRYQLTVVDEADESDVFLWAKVVREVRDNRFSIRSSRGGVKVSWQVTGIRKDAFAETHRIPVEVEKGAGEKGLYLHPDAFGQPPERGIYSRPAAGAGAGPTR